MNSQGKAVFLSKEPNRSISPTAHESNEEINENLCVETEVRSPEKSLMNQTMIIGKTTISKWDTKFKKRNGIVNTIGTSANK
jgi:hypothetical protein